jgi:Flp pilus assembly protein CpaB
LVARAVTIEVPEDGQKVALAGQIGTLSLALRRADDIGAGSATPSQETIRIQDLRAEAEIRHPQAPQPQRQPSSRPVRASGPSVEITRGFTSNRAIVASE